MVLLKLLHLNFKMVIIIESANQLLKLRLILRDFWLWASFQKKNTNHIWPNCWKVTRTMNQSMNQCPA